jgi:hypothetical protein
MNEILINIGRDHIQPEDESDQFSQKYIAQSQLKVIFMATALRTPVLHVLAFWKVTPVA